MIRAADHKAVRLTG
jgi:uncharacterized hydrophobic protein (TIGR00271 family)